MLTQLEPTELSEVESAVMARAGSPMPNGEIRFRCPQPGHADEHPSARFNSEKLTWFCDTEKKGGGFFSTPWPYLIGGVALAGGGAALYIMSRPGDAVTVTQVNVQAVR